MEIENYQDQVRQTEIPITLHAERKRVPHYTAIGMSLQGKAWQDEEKAAVAIGFSQRRKKIWLCRLDEWLRLSCFWIDIPW